MSPDEIITNSSCRICNCPIADSADSVALFTANNMKTPSGSLFEELIGIQILYQPAHYPRCICSGCDLQIKLFKRLKEKAFTTLKIIESKTNVGETLENKKISEITIEKPTFENESIAELTKRKDTGGAIEDHTEKFGTIEDTLNYNDFFLTEQIEDNCEQIEDLSTKVDELNSMFVVYSEDEEVNSITDSKLVEKSPEETNNLVQIDILTDTVDCNSIDELTEMNYTTVDVLDNKIDEQNFSKCNEMVNIRNSPVVKKERNFTCKECSKEFKTVRLLRAHRSQEHTNLHYCTKCEKHFRSLESLEIHMKEHLGLPAFSCDLCNRTFKQKVHYQYHMKRHNNERNFKCNECGKAYVSKSDLGTHLRMHSDIRPFECLFEDCGKKFYTEQHLKMHTYYHMEEKIFECNICHRKFTSPTVLRTHLQTIHSTERRFECTKCGNKFRRKHHLEAHLLSHERNSIENSEYLVMENEDDADDVMHEEGVVENNEDNFNTNANIKENIVDMENINDIDNDEDFIQATIESCSETDAEDDLSKTCVEDSNYFELFIT